MKGKGIARREDEVLSDQIRMLLSLSFSIAPQLSFVQVSGGSRCSEERPCASGSTSILFPLLR